jgi:hypothetical protein
VVVTGEGITAMGPSGTVKIPAGARVLGRARLGWIRPRPAPAAGLKTCVGCEIEVRRFDIRLMASRSTIEEPSG